MLLSTLLQYFVCRAELLFRVKAYGERGSLGITKKGLPSMGGPRPPLGVDGAVAPRDPVGVDGAVVPRDHTGVDGAVVPRDHTGEMEISEAAAEVLE